MSKYRPTFGPYLELHTVQGEYVTVLKQQRVYSRRLSAEPNDNPEATSTHFEQTEDSSLEQVSANLRKKKQVASSKQELFVDYLKCSMEELRIGLQSVSETIYKSLPQGPQKANKRKLRASKDSRRSRKQKIDYRAQLAVVACLLMLAFLAGFFRHHFGRKVTSTPITATIKEQQAEPILKVETVAEIPSLPADEALPQGSQAGTSTKPASWPEQMGEISKRKTPKPRAPVSAVNPPPVNLEIPPPILPPEGQLSDRQSREQSNRELVELFEQLDASEIPAGARKELRNAILGQEK